MHDKNPNPVKLLLIEDNKGDILLLEEALNEINIRLDLDIVNEGEKAMKYLHRLPPFEEKTRPDLILLDMNIPKKNGFEILKEIKNDADLKAIPVIILSTSKAAMDIDRSYMLHANCFISKPGELKEYFDKIKEIMTFWLTTANLPTKHHPDKGFNAKNIETAGHL